METLQQPPAVDVAERGAALSGVALTGVLVGLILTLLLDAIDQNVVGTAMPRIIGQLRGFDRYPWVVTAYFLAMTTAVPIIGKLSDQFGRKWFVVGGEALFLVGSALCGGARSIDELIAFRTIQGAGAGIGLALVYTVAGDVFEPAARARWLGIFGAVTGFASVGGPTLGGLLADHGPLLGSLIAENGRWRWVFYVNLPLGLLALVALLVYLPAGRAACSTPTGWAAVRRIDFPGAVLVATVTLSLLIGLTWVGSDPTAWTSPRVVGTLAVAGLGLVGFVLAERVAVEPILPLGLFRDRVFAANSALSLLQMMALFGLAFFVPMFLQGVLGASPTESGALMTPFSVSIPVGVFLAGTAIGHFKGCRRIAILGALIMAGGAFLLTRLTPSTGLASVVTGTAIAGLGMGMLFPVLTLVVQSVVPPTQLGVGTGSVRYLGQIGGLLGIAIVGSVVNQSLVADLDRRLPAAALTYVRPAGGTSGAETRLLLDPAYRETVVQRAIQDAATAVPAGPERDRRVAAVSAQVQNLLSQALEELRLALAAAIERGLAVVLLFCGAAILAALFVKDVRE